MKAKLKRIYALHGMAGSPNDWNILEEELKGSDYKIIKADSYDPKVLVQIEEEETNVIVITHSWGAYVLIKCMSKLNITEKIEKVVLVNPYIEVENRLKPLITLLLQLPFIGNIMIQWSHKTGPMRFLQKIISPYRFLDIAYFTELEEHLRNLNEWRKTVLAKVKHQKEPLSVDLRIDIPVYVLIGLKDRAVKNEFQLNLIRKIFSHVELHEFANEGHGILWTQAQKIKEIFDYQMEKSGKVKLA